MSTIPSLYARLPKGTRVRINTGWISPHPCGGDLYREATVLADKGDEVLLSIDYDGFGKRGPVLHTAFKCRITEVLAGPRKRRKARR